MGLRKGGDIVRNCHLSNIKVDKVFGFVRYIASKITTNNNMPGWVVLFVKFFLDIC